MDDNSKTEIANKEVEESANFAKQDIEESNLAIIRTKEMIGEIDEMQKEARGRTVQERAVLERVDK